MLFSTPLSHHSRPHGVAQALRNTIVSRELRPGARLIELKLAKSFHVGRPTLRGARATFWKAHQQVV